jgi:hypothetical protein
VEADFQRFYGLDLRDEVKRSGCRRLWALIESLPPDAATWRVDLRGWSLADELAAQQIETVDLWGRLTFQALHGLLAGKRPKQMPDPIRIEHPGRVLRREPKPVERDASNIRQFFNKMKG